MRYCLTVLLAVVVISGAPGPGEATCVGLEDEHLPEVVRPLQLGVTTPEEVRDLLGGDDVEVAERWDHELGGDDELVVEGLASMTPNHGLHYGEISVRQGAVNLESYLLLTFRFAKVSDSAPVLYFIGVTTTADDDAGVCGAAQPLSDRLAEQKRPKVPPNLPPPRSTETRFTFYPCLDDGRRVIVKCDDGNVTVTFNGERYPITNVSYELLLRQ
jgi:hypothetical protein